jgi:probable F420-dependent oxidoreductase
MEHQSGLRPGKWEWVVKYGICLIKTPSSKWVAAAQRAEQLGFESVWVAEHLVFPIDMASHYPGAVTPAGTTGTNQKPMSSLPVFDAPSALNHIAGATSTIRLGTFVYLLGLRHPFVSARAFQTLDCFSGGRVDVGVGAGWLESEWRAAGFDPMTRGRQTEEALAVCRRLWTEPEVEHKGEFWQFEAVAFEPKPVQLPHPPIHIGGESKAAFRRIAEYGQGWLGHEHTPETIKPALDMLNVALEKQNRTLDEVQITVTGQPATLDDQAMWEELGVERMMLTPGSRATGGDTIKALEAFAETFIVPQTEGILK